MRKLALVLLTLGTLFSIALSCTNTDGVEKTNIWQRKTEQISILLEDVFKGNGIKYELKNSINPLVALHPTVEQTYGSTNEKFNDVISIDQYLNVDGSQVFALLDYNSNTQVYSVWFALFNPTDVGPSWGNQKTLTTSSENCFSVQLYTDKIAFVNCVTFQSTLNPLSKNRNVMFSFSSAEQSPIAPLTIKSNDFDNKVTQITQRKMRIVQFGATQFVLLFSSSDQVEWSSNEKSLMNIFTYDGTTFTDAGTIMLDGRNIDLFDFADVDSTKNDLMFLSKTEQTVYRVTSFTTDTSKQETITTLTFVKNISNDYLTGKKIAIQRYQFDTTGQTIYFVLVTVNNLNAALVSAYRWKQGSASPILDRKWDGKNSQTSCNGRQAIYISRDYVVQQCVYNQVNIYPRYKPQNEDSTALSISETMALTNVTRVLVSSDDKLYITATQSFNTYQLQQPYVFIQFPIAGKFNTFTFTLVGRDSLGACQMVFDGQVAKDDIHSVYQNGEAKSQQYSLNHGDLLRIEDKKDFIGPAITFQTQIQPQNSVIEDDKEVKGQVLVIQTLKKDWTLREQPLQFVSSWSDIDYSKTDYFNFLQTNGHELLLEKCVAKIYNFKSVECRLEQRIDFIGLNLESQISLISFSGAVDDSQLPDGKQLFLAAITSLDGSNTKTIISLFSMDPEIQPSTIKIASTYVKSARFDNNRLFVVQDTTIIVYRVFLSSATQLSFEELKQEAIDYNKVSGFIGSKEWTPINVFKSTFDTDIIFVQLETKIICIRFEQSQIYLVSQITLDAGIKSTDIAVQIYDTLLSVIYISPKGQSIYREYRISNPYSLEKLVDRATFGYQFVSPLKVAYSESSENAYILAKDSSNQYFILGFNSEQRDIDGLDSITPFTHSVEDTFITVAGRHENDYLMIYDGQLNTISVNFFPDVQYYVFTAQNIDPKAFIQSSDVILYFKTMGVRSEEFSIESVLQVFNIGSSIQSDQEFVKSIKFDMKDQKEASFQLNERKVVTGGSFISFINNDSNNPDKVTIENVVSSAAKQRIFEDQSKQILSTYSTGAQFSYSLINSGVIRVISLKDLSVSSEIQLNLDIFKDQGYQYSPMKPFFDSNNKLLGFVLVTCGSESLDCYVVTVTLDADGKTAQIGTNDATNIVNQMRILDSAVVGNVFVFLQSTGVTGINFSEESFGRTFSIPLSNIASNIALYQISESVVHLMVMCQFDQENAGQLTLYEISPFDIVQGSFVKFSDQIGIKAELIKQNLIKDSQTFEIFKFRHLQVKGDVYTFCTSLDQLGSKIFLFNVKVERDYRRITLVNFPQLFAAFANKYQLIDWQHDDKFIYGIFQEVIEKEKEFNSIVARFDYSDINDTPATRRLRANNLEQTDGSVNFGFACGGLKTSVDEKSNSYLTLVKEPTGLNSLILYYSTTLEKIQQIPQTTINTQNIDTYYSANLKLDTWDQSQTPMTITFNIVKDENVVPVDPTSSQSSESSQSSSVIPPTSNSSNETPTSGDQSSSTTTSSIDDSSTKPTNTSGDDYVDPKNDQLSTGEIVGIIFGVFGAVALIGGGVFFYLRKAKLKESEEGTSLPLMH